MLNNKLVFASISNQSVQLPFYTNLKNATKDLWRKKKAQQKNNNNTVKEN